MCCDPSIRTFHQDASYDITQMSDSGPKDSGLMVLLFLVGQKKVKY